MRIKYYTLLSAVIGTVMVLGSTLEASAQTKSQFEGGKICYTYETEMPQRSRTDGTCFTGSVRNEHGNCVAQTSFTNIFNFILNDDNSMDFGFSYWFPSSAHCGLIGVATESENGWHYSYETDIANEKCEINIIMDDQKITLTAEEDAPCTAQCGVGAAVRNLEFPLSYINSKKIWPADLLPENIFNAGCE